MTDHFTDLSQRQTALVAGFGLLIMTLFAIFSVFFVFPKLIVPGDAVTTVNNITANEGLFRAGICSLLIVIIFDVLVAWALYVFLKPVSRSFSLLAAWFRLVYSIIFGITLVHYFGVLRLLEGTEYLKVFNIDQLHAKVMLSINTSNDGWAIGYIFFGFHLALLGYLVFKSGTIPRILGILLFIAGLGYLIEYLGKFLFPDFDGAIGMITAWGELLFMVWLLFKGGKTLSKDRNIN